MKVTGRIFFLLFTVILLAGCNEKVIYHYGWYTKEIIGRFELKQIEKPEQQFILVQQYHRTFIENQKGVFRVSTKIVFPQKDSTYRVSLLADVAKISLTFFARGYGPETISFNRSLGVEKFQFSVKLNHDYAWKDNFYLKIQPFLSDYILEPGYRMPERDQLFLGNWLVESQKFFSREKPGLSID